jgi:tRNA(Leu) C34 or U34 (ribose-2'-O)-methylase TrmL
MRLASLRHAKTQALRAIASLTPPVAITLAATTSSAGAWVHLRIARCCKGTSAIEDLKQAGYWIAALAPEGAVTVYDFDTTRRPVRVVGSEGRGVCEIVKKGTDVVRIPMRGRIGSLNVSVVVALALFEIARRRGATAAAPAAGTTVGADAGGGRIGITDAGARPLRPGTATAFAARDGSVRAFDRKASRLATACCIEGEYEGRTREP